MPIFAIIIIADTIRNVVLQQLRVLKDIHVSGIISVFCLLLGMLMAAVLGLKTGMGIYGVAVGYALGIVIADIGLLCRWWPRIQPDQIRISQNQPPQAFSIKSCGQTLLGWLGCSGMVATEGHREEATPVAASNLIS